MVIQNNTSALRVYNAGRTTKSALSKNLEKLSTGYRINRAADDAAGLGVSERIHAKTTELDRSQRNATEGMDLARTADAALQEVNDMLKRARSLCIQAENGTYGNQELVSISGEMNQLFGEIDRITAGSCYNTIRLFCQGIKTTFHEEVMEYYTPVKDILETWGDLDFITEKEDFDPAEDAKPATVSFELDDSVDPDDLDTMEGKAITVGSRTYYFTRKSYLPSGIYNATKVGIGTTMEDTLANMVSASRYYNSSTRTYVQDLSAASINGRAVTLKAALRDLNYQTNGLSYAAKEGDGEWANGILSAVSPTGMGTLNAIDGTNASDNPVKYTMANKAIALTYSVLPSGKKASNKLTADEIENLAENTFRLCFVKDNTTSVVEIPLGDLNVGGTLLRNLQGNKKTWSQFATALRTAVKAKLGSNYTVAGSGANITITQAAAKVDKNSRTYFYTDVQTGKISGGSGSQELGRWTSTGVNPFKVTQTPGGAERPEKCTVEISDLSKQKIPFSFSVNGSSHLYYNPNDSAYTKFTSQSGVNLYTSASNEHSVTSVTSEQVANDIRSQVERALGNATVTVNGSKLEITAGTTGDPNAIMNALNNMFRSTTCTIRAVKGATSSTYSRPVIPYGTYSNQIPTASVTFDFGSGDPKTLEGKGFSVDGMGIEFFNSDQDESVRSNYDDIDLKDLTTSAQVKDAVLARLNRYGGGYTATMSGTKLTIKRSARSMSVTDGVQGMDPLSKGGTVKFDGGVNTGHSQKAIDFSSITEDNLDTLLGKGFRINCATCSGEYINIFFCWTDDGSLPKSFGKVDPETGITRTIHNIPVELSKVTSGDKIVENIVEQVRPTLNHFTDLMVGNPPTVLLAMEKRIGDVIFDNELKLGSVETGMEANFTYSIERKMVADLPEGDLEELESAKVNIYVGSDPEAQIIPIHLPYIDLYHLRLRPPESVDLTAEDQDPADLLKRIDKADRAISSARGTIGADYNRLEHTIQDLSNAHIQLSDAYSVIRDTDMADMMTEQVKLQILMDAQQSMQAQANQMSQGVLQLLQ